MRTTELALAFNDELEKAGKERMKIIVPLVYGEKQKKVMLEEFAEHEKKYPGEIMLDSVLGALLKSIFYGDNSYAYSLKKWISSVKDISAQAQKHLSGIFSVETLSGVKKEINGKNIVVELNRSPRIRYNVAPSYFTSFAYIAEILEKSDNNGADVANWVEQGHRIHAIAYPATFSYLANRQSRYKTEILVPPIASPSRINDENVASGIFVTVTGIPGLERLYGDSKRLGIKLYSNDTNAVPGSERALPHIISNKNILFQFARSGWSSVWISMISGTPLVVPDFDKEDDPEIYFNNRSIEELGLGIVYRGQKLEEILSKRGSIQKSCKAMCDNILKRWGTLDGNAYCAELFADDFLKTKS